MCGIAGAVCNDSSRALLATEVMCRQMIARGPDDGGVELVDARGRAVVLGNRRLAIIDTSAAGHQPMTDPARGCTIVYNGMIYNFAELRGRLVAEGEDFTSNCDTEVILKAYGRYGPACVPMLRGMFAFAIWDPRASRLLLARDRLGIKPLYYTWKDGALLFASQVKALLATGLVAPRLSAEGIATYLASGAVAEPLTAIEGVAALPAGHTALMEDDRWRIEPYWNPPGVAAVAPGSEPPARALRSLLEDTVDRHLVSDAPLGIFLSGGLDSSVLAALAARRTDRLHTLSVAFREAAYSEGDYADEVARHIGSQHERIELTQADLFDGIEDVFEAMDQPTSDGVNTYVVARAAHRAGLTVALSGLGADELFDGYGYVRRVTLMERYRRAPAPMRWLAAEVIGHTGGGARKDKLGAWLSGQGGESAYSLLRGLFLPREIGRLSPALVAGEALPAPPKLDLHRDVFNQVSAMDLRGYTLNMLLRDTDAMSMAHSLEVRVPFLDHVLVEHVLRLPAAAKAGGGKALLVAAVRDLLPRTTLERRKHGFFLPLAHWMRGEARAAVSSVLANQPPLLNGLIEPDAARAVWTRFQHDGKAWLRAWSLYALYQWAESVARIAPSSSQAERQPQPHPSQ